MTADAGQKRVLVLVVAYNAVTTIRDVLARIPASLNEDYRLAVPGIDHGAQVAPRERAAVPTDRAAQPGQSGLRRKPEDRLPLRPAKRLRPRRPGARRRAIRAGTPAAIAGAAARRRGRR